MNIFVQNRFFPKVDDKTYICNKLFFITKNVLLLKNHRVNSNNLNRNRLKEIPKSIERLPNLRRLSLDGNNIKNISKTSLLHRKTL